jgi:spectinomycin phosphotransferase
LQTDYRLQVSQITFLPLGADVNTAVYRVTTDNETQYFLKLRSGGFDETAVTLPKFLSDQGIVQIIPPLAAKTGQLWANLDPFKLILYPYIEGRNGYEVELSDRHWMDFAKALKRIHTALIPDRITELIRPETYSPKWRETVKRFVERIEHSTYADPVAVKSAAFLRSRSVEILDLVERSERLARILQAKSPGVIVCHSDLHAGNILIDDRGALFIVDWDNPILAPKERDLMFIGGGQGFSGHTAQEEESLFYQGYGRTEIDPFALAYYRYERIVEDIAVECEQIFLTNEGGDDREQTYQFLTSNFRPNGVIEIAYQSDTTLRND